jgi:tRNA-2-methylthio-N6-dimethylallyladenosine synthase
MEEVLEEIRGLMEEGVGEITLLGQNVNSYKYGLANLLRAIGELALSTKWRGGTPTKVGVGEVVIRFLTSHPRDMTDEIIESVAQLPFVAKEFHLPLQSGNDAILEKMHRGYTVACYQGLIKKIRNLMPRSRITTDVMVGFPGETEKQFEDTIALIKKIKFDGVNMFAYSRRAQTAAGKMPEQLPDEVKQARLRKLIETNRQILAPVI